MGDVCSGRRVRLGVRGCLVFPYLFRVFFVVMVVFLVVKRVRRGDVVHDVWYHILTCCCVSGIAIALQYFLLLPVTGAYLFLERDPRRWSVFSRGVHDVRHS